MLRWRSRVCNVGNSSDSSGLAGHEEWWPSAPERPERERGLWAILVPDLGDSATTFSASLVLHGSFCMVIPWFKLALLRIDWNLTQKAGTELAHKIINPDCVRLDRPLKPKG